MCLLPPSDKGFEWLIITGDISGIIHCTAESLGLDGWVFKTPLRRRIPRHITFILIHCQQRHIISECHVFRSLGPDTIDELLMGSHNMYNCNVDDRAMHNC